MLIIAEQAPKCRRSCCLSKVVFEFRKSRALSIQILPSIQIDVVNMAEATAFEVRSGLELPALVLSFILWGFVLICV
jgi:hypothetical protein